MNNKKNERGEGSDSASDTLMPGDYHWTYRDGSDKLQYVEVTEEDLGITKPRFGKGYVSHDKERDHIDFHVPGYKGYNFRRPRYRKDLLEWVAHLNEKQEFPREAILDFVLLCAKIEGFGG